MDLSFRELLFLVTGMFLGASMITWGLADESNLPSKDKINNWTNQYYQEQIVNRDPDIINVYVKNISGSRFPGLYSASLVKEELNGQGRRNTSEDIFISRDGLQTGKMDTIRIKRPDTN